MIEKTTLEKQIKDCKYIIEKLEKYLKERPKEGSLLERKVEIKKYKTKLAILEKRLESFNKKKQEL